MDTIRLENVNEVFYRIIGEPSAIAEMSSNFTFSVPNAHFMPAYKMKVWDGKTRFVMRPGNLIYRGLIEQIKKFASRCDYSLEYPKNISEQINDLKLQEFIESQKLTLVPREYQLNCLKFGINNQRAAFESATGSGKSLLIYLLTKYYTQISDQKVLIIVPTLNLINQMKSDFLDYSKNNNPDKLEENIHLIFAGQTKTTNCRIVISTWQSLHKMQQVFFDQFGFVLVDEAHQAKANSLKKILTKCVKANWRFGTTGTMDDSPCNSFLIEGLTGPRFLATTTKQLMDDDKLAKLKINCVVLKYSEEECKKARKFAYIDEIDYLLAHQKRNNFIKKLSLSQKGNTLLLFQFVEKHGKILYEILKKAAPDRKIYFIYGKTEMQLREEIRQKVESEENAIILASAAIFSTGVNMPNLETIIFALTTKSRIRVLQSIGRVLRIGRSDKAVVYDIVDDLQHKKKKNYALKHFIERSAIYAKEEFEYSIFNIPL